MTLTQISEGISEHVGEWGKPYKDLLQEVPDDPRILAKLQSFVRYAANRRLTLGGNMPGPYDFQDAIAAASVAAFRLGLLIGLKLDPPGLVHVSEVAESMDLLSLINPETEECEVCYGSGSVCNRCGKSVNACNCSDGNRDLFDPVTCDACNGQGVVSK